VIDAAPAGEGMAAELVLHQVAGCDGAMDGHVHEGSLEAVLEGTALGLPGGEFAAVAAFSNRRAPRLAEIISDAGEATHRSYRVGPTSRSRVRSATTRLMSSLVIGRSVAAANERLARNCLTAL